MSDFSETDAPVQTRFFVFMGVCGVGKSTVAASVASVLAGTFIEGDLLHPRENVEAMAGGRPLSDEQRWPWLASVCDASLAVPQHGPVTIACSALRVPYRDFMRSLLPRPVFVYLDGPEPLIRERMAGRTGHFMTVGMLDSQLAIVEPPLAEPRCHTVDIRVTREEAIAQSITICRRYLNAAKPQDA